MAEQKKEEEVEEEEVVPQPSFKLKYYPFAGDAAALRLAAYVGGISYTDEFIEGNQNQNESIKWCDLPEIEIYNDQNKAIINIGCSNTILRYIGSLCNLYPVDNPLIAALCDECLDSCRDTKTILTGNMSTKEDRQKLIAKDGKLTYWLNKFENRLTENAKRGHEQGYIVGDNLTVADLKLFELFHSLWLIFEAYEDIPKDFIANYPQIQKHYQLVKETESVQEFLQKFSLRNSEYKLDKDDVDVKIQTSKGKFVPGSL